MINWAGNGIVSYYLVPILKTVDISDSLSQSSINLGLQCWNGRSNRLASTTISC